MPSNWVNALGSDRTRCSTRASGRKVQADTSESIHTGIRSGTCVPTFSSSKDKEATKPFKRLFLLASLTGIPLSKLNQLQKLQAKMSRSTRSRPDGRRAESIVSDNDGRVEKIPHRDCGESHRPSETVPRKMRLYQSEPGSCPQSFGFGSATSTVSTSSVARYQYPSIDTILSSTGGGAIPGSVPTGIRYSQ